MFEVVDGTMPEIVLVYIAFISASLLVFPLVKLIYNAVKRGASQWK